MNYIKDFEQLIILLTLTFALCWILSFVTACTSSQNTSQTTTTTIPPLPAKIGSLSWEKNHPERKVWSDSLLGKLSNLSETFESATDWERLCPKYKTLTKDTHVLVWGELFSALSFYESSWNPSSSSVDVGSASNKDTWSVGLLQVSVTDQYGVIPQIYQYKDLLQALPNLDLGLKIMERQLKARKKIILENSDSLKYWSTILDGNRYQKISQIQAMVSLVPGCK